MKQLSVILLLIAMLVLTTTCAQAQSDSDGDTIDDTTDNCLDLFNARQRDADGDGVGDACDMRTRNGRFASYLHGVDEDHPLRKADGTPILPAEVPDVYGTPDGMTILDGDMDVTSWDYAVARGLTAPLLPVYQDLSDAAGWPEVHVKPGTVAIDPPLGRFGFAEGDDDPLSLVGSEWTGFGVPGSGFIQIQDNHAVMPAGEGDFQVLDISDRTDPSVVGHLRVDFNWVAAVYGDYAYISQGRSDNGISAIDISDPTSPQWAQTTVWPFAAFDIKTRAGLAYVTQRIEDGGFSILDLSNPLELVEIGRVDVGDPEGATWIFLSGDRAYVGLGTARGAIDRSIAYGPKTAGFAVIDIADPRNPTLMGTYLGEPEAPRQNGGLLAFYPFDGDASDLSGNRLHGVVHDAVSVNGFEGGAYAFDGDDDYIWSPVNINTSEQPRLTMGAWVNAASLPQHNQAFPILTNNGRALYMDHRWCDSPRGRWCATGVTGPPTIINEWVFLAVVYDQDTERVTLYVDDNVYTGTGAPVDFYDTLRIGSIPNWPWDFHGQIDNIFFFAETLTAGQIDDIRLRGAQAILELGNTLAVTYAEQSEPLPPQKLPRLIGVSGDLAILAQTWIPPNYPLSQPAKLILVDASDPGNLHRRASHTFQHNLWTEPKVDLFSAAAKGAYLYITDDGYDYTQDSLNACPWCTDDPYDSSYRYYYEDYTSLFTFDISDLDDPKLVDRYDHPQPSRFRHMTMDGDNLFINDYNYGMRVFSLANPAQPALVGGTVTATEGHYGWVNESGDTGFSSQTFGGAIHSVDLSDPFAPAKEGIYWDGEWSEKRRFTGRGNYLYVPTQGGVTIVDVTNPAEPIRHGQYPGVYQMPDISLFDDYAYVLTSDSPTYGGQHNMRRFLNIYDISDPSSPLWVNEAHPIDFETRQIGVHTHGGYAFVLSADNLTIVDVGNPQQPYVLGHLNDPTFVIKDSWYPIPMQVQNGYAYIITGKRDARLFHIVDVLDPANPQLVETVTHSGSVHVTDIIVSGKYLYLGVYWGTFWIYDITNPIAPEFVASAADLPLGGWGASWSLGGLFGEYLAVPALSRFHVVDVPRDAEGPYGIVSVAANIVTNAAPDVDAGGPYSVDEGGTVAVNATGSDPDGDGLAYSWDLDGDGSYETPGQSVTFSAATLDGPSSYGVAVQAADPGGLAATDPTSVDVQNVAPTVTPGADATIDEGTTFNGSGSFSDPGPDTWSATVDFGDGSGPQPLALNPDNTFALSHIYDDNGVFSVLITVADDDGGSDSVSVQVAVNNVVPGVAAPAIQPEPSDEGSSVTANATFIDPGTDDGPFSCTVDYGDGSGEQGGTVDGNTCTGPAHTYNDNSSYAVVVKVTDKDGGTGTSQAATHIVNNVAPTATFANTSGTIDEGRSVTVVFTDQADPSTADREAGFRYGYDYTNDGTFDSDESAGPTFACSYLDNGAFTILGRIEDKDGGFTDYPAVVAVNNVAPDVGPITAPLDPVAVNTPIDFTTVFTDPGVLDTHTAIWEWGDGASCETANADAGCSVIPAAGSGTANASHTYNVPGVYTIQLIVTDTDGGQGESTYRFVVVYDPEGGFVTGGGWIDSPEGAYPANPSLTGKATFGFVSKYKKGAKVPTGQTEFQFRIADLNFHSSVYDWLVVAGHKAQFKGTGTINGAGNYGFMLTATDEKLTPSTDVDLFRIKIWDKDNGDVIIYDNQLGAEDDADPATAIAGGNIVVHKSK